MRDNTSMDLKERECEVWNGLVWLKIWFSDELLLFW
jgi:hypothetical protein